MNYRRLGDAGMKLSEIGLGGWLTFGNAVEIEACRAIFDKAFEVGINFFDNANGYAAGKCEEMWGHVLKDRPRDSYVLATKVFAPMGPDVNQRGLSRKAIMEQCHASLRRLQSDHIDLYQCHRHDPDTPMEETVRAFDDLIRQGKVIYWGFSEWPVEKVEEALRVCGDRYYKPKGSQPRYSAINRQWEKELFPLCHQAGIGQVVFSPLAQGALTGKYKPGEPVPEDSRAADARQNKFIGKFLTEEILAKVQKLRPIADELSCTIAQLALAWCLRRPEVTSCITGASRPQQVEDNAKASDVKLNEETVRRIDETLA